LDIVQTVTGLHKGIDFFLLVRWYLQAQAGHPQSLQGGDQSCDESKDLGLLVLCAQKHDVVLMKLGEEVIGG
jgi:hypothetical protein